MGVFGVRRWICFCFTMILLAAPALASNKFIISTFHGFLAVWENGQATPYLITDTLVSSLPPADQVSIEQGLFFDTEADVTGALEDFCS